MEIFFNWIREVIFITWTLAGEGAGGGGGAGERERVYYNEAASTFETNAL